MRLLFLAFISILIITIYLGICKNSPAPPIEVVSDSMEVLTAPPRRFMQVTTPHLRVRKTPDLEGSVLQTLQEGVLVEYLNDSTQFTTVITYNNKQHHRNWYKIRTDEAHEGWVYAAFVEFLGAVANQKVVTQKELLEVKNPPFSQSAPTEKKTTEQQVNTVLIQTYQNYLEQLNTESPQSVSNALNRYQTLFIGQNNTSTHDKAYQKFRVFYAKVLQNLQRRSLSNYQGLKTEVQRYHRAYMQRDVFTQELAKNGFNFGIDNGKVVIVEDVDFLYRVFYREMSTPMRAYMNQYQLEEPNFWWQQEMLVIPPKELATWVLAWNYFVAKYPDFMWHNDAKRRLSEQLNILLQGSPSTPAFDEYTKILKQDYQEAYLYIINNYPDSRIGKAFQQYTTILEKNDWMYSAFVGRSQQQLLEQLLE